MMLEVMKGEKAVGIYSAGYKLIEFLSIIPGTVTIAALPGLSADFSKNIEAFRLSLVRTIAMLGISGAVIGSLLYGFSRQVILLLYGPLFSDSALSLRILSMVVFFIFVNGYFAYVAIATNNERAVAIILIIATLLNIICNYYLISRYSHVGAALSTLFSEILMLISYSVFFLKGKIYWKKNAIGNVA
jgi:O-antigen/teichoic acid export membrane protein